ncbi:MAG TPA: hypothetical protein VJI75_03665 [Candidatus Nanoarchaeia archaeon]|nr:hypothetical protein [Candidatus Nanoarchaeia archaeon]
MYLSSLSEFNSRHERLMKMVYTEEKNNHSLKDIKKSSPNIKMDMLREVREIRNLGSELLKHTDKLTSRDLKRVNEGLIYANMVAGELGDR